MKLSYLWLKEYVALPENITAKMVADKLSNSGFEIEEVKPLSCNMPGIVIGYVKERKAHPNSDHLSVCQVDLGKETLQIVCGAPNVAAGQTVPVATVGTDFGGGFIIKKSKLRGEDSNGMICSEAELGLSHNHDGIMILDTRLPTGTPIEKYFSNHDVVLDLSITPNRADCLSHIGIARELSVMFDVPFLYKKTDNSKLKKSNASSFNVTLNPDSSCERFTAQIIKGVKIAESPKWMKDRLQAAGVRSINNVVDISNYVMLELGMPMHFYDLNKLAEKSFTVRVAKENEKVTTLDNKIRTLTTNSAVIECAGVFAGLGGIMGGLDSEISPNTVDLLVESAIWNQTKIQRAQRDLNMLTDASYRYSKGVDYNLPLIAQARAAELLIELCSGTIDSDLIDIKLKDVKDHYVSFRKDRCDLLLGHVVEREFIERVFTSLEFKKIDDTNYQIPTYRQDIEREVDLIEEVARIYGLNNIPGKKLTQVNFKIEENKEDLFADDLKHHLCSLGLQEIITNSMTPKADFLIEEERAFLEIVNPLSDEMNIMRSSLIPSLMRVAEFNINHKMSNLKLFEVNKDYYLKKNKNIETRKLSVLLSGMANDKHWSEPARKIDFYDIKGLAQQLLNYLQIKNVKFIESKHIYLSVEQLAVEYNGRVIMQFGKVSAACLKQLKITGDFFVLEMPITVALETSLLRNKEIKEINRFPVVERDVAVVCKKTHTAKDMLEVIKTYCGALLLSAEVFDIYSDKTFAKDEHSIAFKMFFSANKTLTEDDIDPVFNGVIKILEEKFNGKLRN